MPITIAPIGIGFLKRAGGSIFMPGSPVMATRDKTPRVTCHCRGLINSDEASHAGPLACDSNRNALPALADVNGSPSGECAANSLRCLSPVQHPPDKHDIICFNAIVHRVGKALCERPMEPEHLAVEAGVEDQ